MRRASDAVCVRGHLRERTPRRSPADDSDAAIAADSRSVRGTYPHCAYAVPMRRTTRRRGAATFSFAQTLVATGGAALHPFHFRKPTRLALRVLSPALKPATAPWPSRSIVTIGEGKCPHLLNFSKVSGGGEREDEVPWPSRFL